MTSETIHMQISPSDSNQKLRRSPRQSGRSLKSDKEVFSDSNSKINLSEIVKLDEISFLVIFFLPL